MNKFRRFIHGDQINSIFPSNKKNQLYGSHEHGERSEAKSSFPIASMAASWKKAACSHIKSHRGSDLEEIIWLSIKIREVTPFKTVFLNPHNTVCASKPHLKMKTILISLIYFHVIGIKITTS